MANFGAGITGIGEGIGGIISSRGAKKAAKQYDKAEQYALQAAGLERVSTDVKLMAAQREIYQTVGAQKAAFGGAGLEQNFDLLADSQSQGALTMALTSAQGEINALGADAQAASYNAQAALQRAAAKGGLISGIFKVAGSVAGMASDRRLKRDIVLVGTYPNGLPMYEFCYTHGDQRFRGVMSDDVRAKYPEAVTVMADGYDAVYYEMLGIRMEEV
tara:strand:+ start:11309 stop:11959 length:651 start_codon:yes stop_codon:yes gene_type:complete